MHLELIIHGLLGESLPKMYFLLRELAPWYENFIAGILSTSIMLGVTLPIHGALLVIMESRYLELLDNRLFRLTLWLAAFTVLVRAEVGLYQYRTGSPDVGGSPLVYSLLAPCLIYLFCLVVASSEIKRKVSPFKVLLWLTIFLFPFIMTGVISDIYFNHPKVLTSKWNFSGAISGFSVVVSIFLTLMTWIFQEPWKRWEVIWSGRDTTAP